jgi:hypothetical protein
VIEGYGCNALNSTNSIEITPASVLLNGLNYNNGSTVADKLPQSLSTPIQAIVDYDSDNKPFWLTSGPSDSIVLQSSQSVEQNVLGSNNAAYLYDIQRGYSDATIASIPQCNVSIVGFQLPFPMMHPLSCLGALPLTEVTVAQQLTSDTVPWVSAWSVTPSSVTLGNSFTIQYTATDLSSSTLSTAQFFIAPDKSGQPGTWQPLSTIQLTGNGPTTVTLKNAPSANGKYWYGTELQDSNNHRIWYQSSYPVVVGSATTTYVLTVNSTNPSSGVGITVSPSDNYALSSGNTSVVRHTDSHLLSVA